MFFSVVAMAWINSPYRESYLSFLHLPVILTFAALDISFTMQHFVNDGLMALFFLMVGLEIKREMIVGELSTLKKAALPLIAAFFGMLIPGLIYVVFNSGTPAVRAWGVPVATDIAFALGVLALLGKRVPLGLKIFLAALAIADDLLAVLVIAFFYSSALNIAMLLLSLGIAVALYTANRSGVHSTLFYALLGVALWLSVLFSGIHATLAGVVLALTIPADARIDVASFAERAKVLINKISQKVHSDEDEGKMHDNIHALEQMSEGVLSPLHRFERALTGIVSFGVLPLFALVNAGVLIEPAMMPAMTSNVALGIILGLFVGKQFGITASVWLALRLGIATLPDNVSMKQIYGVSILCGIGFTMALFVAQLAFVTAQDLDVAKLSIMVGSTISAVIGLVVLRMWLPKQLPAEQE